MTLQHWNSMDIPEILCMLISKLPGNTRDRWNRKVLIIRRQHKREPELEDFMDFFDDETQLANDPLFSREALTEYTEKADKGGNNKRRIKQYVGKTKVEKKRGDAKDGDRELKKVQCPVCDESQDRNDCSMFKDQTLEERSKILWKKKLCYGCYSPLSQDHNAKTCKQRRICKVCTQSHPTGLHGYLPKKKQPKVTSDPKDGFLPVDDKKLMTSILQRCI